MTTTRRATKVCNGKHHSAKLDWNLELKASVETKGVKSAKMLGNNWLQK